MPKLSTHEPPRVTIQLRKWRTCQFKCFYFRNFEIENCDRAIKFPPDKPYTFRFASLFPSVHFLPIVALWIAVRGYCAIHRFVCESHWIDANLLLHEIWWSRRFTTAIEVMLYQRCSEEIVIGVLHSLAWLVRLTLSDVNGCWWDVSNFCICQMFTV